MACGVQLGVAGGEAEAGQRRIDGHIAQRKRDMELYIVHFQILHERKGGGDGARERARGFGDLRRGKA